MKCMYENERDEIIWKCLAYDLNYLIRRGITCSVRKYIKHTHIFIYIYVPYVHLMSIYTIHILKLVEETKWYGINICTYVRHQQTEDDDDDAGCSKADQREGIYIHIYM